MYRQPLKFNSDREYFKNNLIKSEKKNFPVIIAEN